MRFENELVEIYNYVYHSPAQIFVMANKQVKTVSTASTQVKHKSGSGMNIKNLLEKVEKILTCKK